MTILETEDNAQRLIFSIIIEQCLFAKTGLFNTFPHFKTLLAQFLYCKKFLVVNSVF